MLLYFGVGFGKECFLLAAALFADSPEASLALVLVGEDSPELLLANFATVFGLIHYR